MALKKMGYVFNPEKHDVFEMASFMTIANEVSKLESEELKASRSKRG